MAEIDRGQGLGAAAVIELQRQCRRGAQNNKTIAAPSRIHPRKPHHAVI
jgi:hypothetical protein